MRKYINCPTCGEDESELYCDKCKKLITNETMVIDIRIRYESEWENKFNFELCNKCYDKVFMPLVKSRHELEHKLDN